VVEATGAAAPRGGAGRARKASGPPAKPAPKRAPKRAKKAEPAKVDGAIVAEPDWSRLLPDAEEQAAAREHWRSIAGEMRERETLSAANRHALLRLVLAYLVYDRCSINVAVDGLVTAPNPENPKSIARLSIHYKAMEEAAKAAERLEAQLGLSPGRRGRVGKVAKKRERRADADAFLGPKG
jgi:P27 family predicted phage terminase small subunit